MLYVNDVSPITLPIDIISSLSATITRVVVRYVPVYKGPTIEWDLTPTAVTAQAVACQRVLQPGDLPIDAVDGYTMRAWAYDVTNTLIFVTDEFQSPTINPERVTAP